MSACHPGGCNRSDGPGLNHRGEFMSAKTQNWIAFLFIAGIFIANRLV